MVLSAPSYVIPGTYGENVEYLSKIPAIQSVELLFFIFDNETRELFTAEKERIECYKDELGFSVHMPDALNRDHEEAILLTRHMADRYILHPPPEDRDAFVDLVRDWRGKYGDIFLLENLIDREFDTLLDGIGDIGICCDVGHLLMRGEEPADFFQKYGPEIGEIHLHGMEEGWDHKGFKPGEPWFEAMLPFLERYRGVLNIEVFNTRDLEMILTTLIHYGVIPGEKAAP